MAQQQQDPRVIQNAVNQQFMSLSVKQKIKAHSQNGNQYRQSATLNFDSPIIAGAYAFGVSVIPKLKVKWDPKTNGTVSFNAAYPHSLFKNIKISFGETQQDLHPVITKFDNMIEGYARVEMDNTKNFEATGISDLIRKVPTTLQSGDNDLTFEMHTPLNFLHPASINGAIPIFSNGTRMQVALQTADAITGKDPLLNVFKVSGDGVLTVEGTVDVVIHYRNYTSLFTTQPLQPDLTNLPTVQVVELPPTTNLAQSTYEYVPLRNPYKFAKIFHIVISGTASDKFSHASDINGYVYEREENSSSAFFKYDESTTGIEQYYRDTREKFGTDLPEGVFVLDTTSDNVANVSAKQGIGYLNLTGNDGFPSSRFGFKLSRVGNDPDITSRIVSYGVMINDNGLKAR